LKCFGFSCVLNNAHLFSHHVQAEPTSNKILINAEWIKDVVTAFHDKPQMRLQRHLLLVKGLHEIAHLMTPVFMRHLGLPPKKQEQYDTPTKIGTMKKGKKTLGDADYGLEECLNGGRIFHEREKRASAFQIARLTLERDKHKFEINSSFVSRKKTKLAQFKPKPTQLINFKSIHSIHNKGAALFYPTHHFPIGKGGEDIGYDRKA
jgi:hypothetical protein